MKVVKQLGKTCIRFEDYGKLLNFLELQSRETDSASVLFQLVSVSYLLLYFFVDLI